MKSLSVTAFIVLIAILFSTIGCSSNSNAGDSTQQGPSVEWSKTFGDSGCDMGFSVYQTSDGGFVITGFTNSLGATGADLFLIKIDTSGDEEWNNMYGGSGFDWGASVIQTSDGGFVIAGHTDSSFGAGGNDVYLVRTDTSGNEQWSKTYGGADDDYGETVLQTSDGGFAIAGHTYSFGAGSDDVYLVKTDVSGNEQWSKTYGSSHSDVGHSMQQTSDGGFIITGVTASSEVGSADVYMIKTDALGNEQWSRTYGGSCTDGANAVQQTSDGGFIVAGYTYSSSTGSDDVYLVKTDTSGNEQWSKTFGDSGSELGTAVQQTDDGGFIVAGYTGSLEAYGEDAYLIKTDASGNGQWSRIYDDSGSEIVLDMRQTGDGGFILVGWAVPSGTYYADVYLLKIGGE